ncbi:hypothetical protein CKAH01_09741 [Colletotrichum kahawae]|uniref:Uncharacterized protein n=1 Tax=Colletotrichum kahawae TaxID=34407 RepID=A0AAD9XXU8_COLKA|nr:hypothetical protein CKAH01_09741 [Colletotrichum kahawae]
MSQHFGNIDIKKKALQEIFEHGHIPQNSEVWSGMDPTGVYCIAELNAARIESYPPVMILEQPVSPTAFGTRFALITSKGPT